MWITHMIIWDGWSFEIHYICNSWDIDRALLPRTYHLYIFMSIYTYILYMYHTGKCWKWKSNGYVKMQWICWNAMDLFKCKGFDMQWTWSTHSCLGPVVFLLLLWVLCYFVGLARLVWSGPKSLPSSFHTFLCNSWVYYFLHFPRTSHMSFCCLAVFRMHFPSHTHTHIHAKKRTHTHPRTRTHTHPHTRTHT